MPIQIESVQTASGNSATTNFTVAAAGENRAIAALVGLYSPLGEEVTSATYANQALTRQALVESSDGDHSEIWTRLDPPAGSNTLALNFTFPGNPRGWVVGGVALSGVESIRGAATANGNSGPANPSLSIATQPGDVVLSVVTFYDAAINPASGATELFDLVDPTEDTYCAGSALTASGASTTVAWAFSGTPAENWALAATAVAPADDEGGGEPTTIDLTAASVGIAGSAIRSRLATALTAPAVAFAAQPTRQSLAVGLWRPASSLRRRARSRARLPRSLRRRWHLRHSAFGLGPLPRLPHRHSRSRCGQRSAARRAVSTPQHSRWRGDRSTPEARGARPRYPLRLRSAAKRFGSHRASRSPPGFSASSAVRSS